MQNVSPVYTGAATVYKTVDTGCLNLNYTQTGKAVKQSVGQGYYFLADSDWQVNFLLKARNRIYLLDAEARVLKWSKLGGCYYLNPFGQTDLPSLEKDLSKLVGPWVTAIWKSDKLHVQLRYKSFEISLATIITTITTFVGHPCGGEVHKPVVYPLPLTPETPKPTGYKWPKVKIPYAPPKDEVTKDQAPSQLDGYEMGPFPYEYSGPTHTYTYFQPPPGKTLYPPLGTSKATTKDEAVAELIAAGNSVTVVRIPEHDNEYRYQLPSNGTSTAVSPEEGWAETAQAYQVTATPKSSGWLSNSDFMNSSGFSGSAPSGYY